MTTRETIDHRFLGRPPDFMVGEKDDPYLLRWWLIPRNRFFNVYLHKFLRDDDDRALHDHPWPSVSIVLKGCGIEHLPDRKRVFRAQDVIFRRAKHAHRIELVSPVVWTLFITGPRVRDWGFHCPKGWVPWQVFCDSRDKGKVGKGCDD